MTTPLAFRPVDTVTWPDLVRLFESPGGPKHCWCMVWRRSAAEAKQREGAARRAMLEARVARGDPIGLVGTLADEPVAWVSIAPRETYRPLGAADDLPPGERVWSLVCFFLKRKHRGEGRVAELIAAAVAEAKARGATLVEAYPVEPDAPSYRFMGFVPSFAAAGFTPAGRAGTRRHVMRLRLPGDA
ncbi:MAG: GNAT family N-acetyltransferase [Bauldia sp.]